MTMNMRTRRKQMGNYKVSGNSDKALVTTLGGQVLEEFDNATTTSVETNAFKRACDWVKSAATYPLPVESRHQLHFYRESHPCR